MQSQSENMSQNILNPNFNIKEFRKCKECKKPTKNKKFCSRYCKDFNNRVVKHPFCWNCDEILDTRISKRKFCSKKCYGEWLHKTPNGHEIIRKSELKPLKKRAFRINYIQKFLLFSLIKKNGTIFRSTLSNSQYKRNLSFLCKKGFVEEHHYKFVITAKGIKLLKLKHVVFVNTA